MKWRLVRMNIEDHNWKSLDEIVARVTDRVMETREGLDRAEAERLFRALWEAED